LPEKFGFDLRKSYMSALVCSGQISRQEALKEIAQPPAPIDLLKQDRKYVIKKLGLTNDEFDQIMKAPNKTYKDYPNNESIWRSFNWFVKFARQRIIRVG